ncbi:MAG: GNAT family N-acetyltransferase [Bacteroidota bacterium]
MKIVQHLGQSDFVYQNIGPFAMNGKVISEFKRYPLLTSENHTWFFAMEGEQVLGFAAIEKKGNNATFLNDYTLPKNRKKGIHKKLIQARLKFAKKQKIKHLVADCTQPCLNQYTKAGFSVAKQYVQWTKVEKSL